MKRIDFVIGFGSAMTAQFEGLLVGFEFGFQNQGLDFMVRRKDCLHVSNGLRRRAGGEHTMKKKIHNWIFAKEGFVAAGFAILVSRFSSLYKCLWFWLYEIVGGKRDGGGIYSACLSVVELAMERVVS
ncbi:hypothetical protein V8G54_013592 [Vigna mungo]|uniref:Uncharacterized protein n=1 Tax=Vigna mungo TaxID=3915 RepID=A0AAQ3NVY7_VIGMU